jgi:penicillin amidase
MFMKKTIYLYIILIFVSTTACWAQTAPQTAKILTVAGLKENVMVRRDDRAIPYIEAGSDADLYFAQGYTTASDRLWQMDLYRRVARGETAELFGNTALEADKRWRRFGFSQIVEEAFKSFTPEYKGILENYARGVNAYIATLDEKTLPIEFQILKYKPSDWKSTDSLVIGAILADGLSTTWQADVMRVSFADLPKEKFDQLFLEKTPLDVLIVGKDNQITDSKFQIPNSKTELIEFALKDEEIRKSSLERIGFYQEFNAASNNWVVSGKRTLDGKPILANDPHLPASAPSIWYLSNLSSPTMRVSGVTFPGVPGIVLGHNEYIAWGATNLGPDVQDLYAETFNDKNQYKTPSGWETAKIRREKIKVRKNVLSPETETEILDVTETRNGVIITEQNGKKYALKWTARDPKNDSFEGFLLLNRAKDWDDFNAALKTYGGAAQNFVYADVKGNIGFHNGGRIPIRRTGDGSMPYDGATGDGDWVSVIPYEELPNSFNPPEGFIVTANQRIVGDSYKYFLTHLWSSPHRARRIYQLLQANSKVTVNDMMDIQRDIFNISYSGFAREVIKTEAASKETLDILRGWDGKMSADSNAALLVGEIRNVFLNKILTANVGAERVKNYRWGLSASFVDWLAAEKPANWLPKEFANFKDLLIASDREARANLSAKYGADAGKWLFGSAFKIRFNHPLSAAPLIGSIFAIDAIPQYGNGLTPNVGTSVSMRHITVPGNWDETRHGIALGESGNPKSSHYRDQLENWKSGNTQVFPFSKAAVEKAAKEVVVMLPIK